MVKSIRQKELELELKNSELELKISGGIGIDKMELSGIGIDPMSDPSCQKKQPNSSNTLTRPPPLEHYATIVTNKFYIPA